MSAVLLKQIVVMFLLMLVGLWLAKRDFISEESASDMGTLLVRVVIPCVILKSFFTEYSDKKMMGACVSFTLALVSLCIAVIISYIIYRDIKRVMNFASSFCNAGFIGIPLAQAAYGDDGVFYISAYIALLNIFQWTYGAYILTGDRKNVNIPTVVKNPVVIALIVGLLVFVSRVTMPYIVIKSVGYIAAMNSPLAMIILGIYMSKLRLKDIFCDISVYICSIFRLVLIPAVTLAFMVVVIRFVPIISTEIAMIILIAVCTPVGANIAVFAKQFNENYLLSVKTVCLSTIISVITIPAFMGVAGYCLQ